jgi:hypothetical protein
MIKLRKLRCSFCGKNETEVSKLVAGPGVYICDGCVAIASQIMNDPVDDQPRRVQSSMWRRLLPWARRLLRGIRVRGGDSFSVSG